MVRILHHIVQNCIKNKISGTRLISWIKENFVFFIFFKSGAILLRSDNYGYSSGVLQKDF